MKILISTKSQLMKNRICNHCKQILPIELFGKNRSNKDGLMLYCKKCINNRPFKRPKKRVCEICNKEKLIKYFINENTNRVSRFCHTCLPKYQLHNYYIKSRENPDKFKQYHKDYKRKYRSKNKEAN